MQVLVAEVQAEYARRYGDGGDASPIEAAEFRAPQGVFVLLRDGGAPVAMGGWRRGGPAGRTDGEIKRMYVRPSHQRRGHARRVLVELERTAVAAGLTRLVLETGQVQPEAIALYESSGYVRIPPFGYYADSPLSVHLARDLLASHPVRRRSP